MSPTDAIDMKHQPINLVDKHDLSVRTQTEVAAIMTERGYPMGKSNVYKLELTALKKIRQGLQGIAHDFGYEIKDS